MDKEETEEITVEVLKILQKTKEEIETKGFEGYDAAYFDVNIDLKVSVDDQTVRVHEKWKRLQDQ